MTDDAALSEEIARVLRLADFAMDHARTSLIAFVDRRYVKAIGRDCDRLKEVCRQVGVLLEQLPPEPPLTQEQEAECVEIIGRALRRFDPGEQTELGSP